MIKKKKNNITSKYNNSFIHSFIYFILKKKLTNAASEKYSQ